MLSSATLSTTLDYYSSIAKNVNCKYCWNQLDPILALNTTRANFFP